jgi:hypothetical protein
MSFLQKVAALEASSFRQDCGLPPRAELASPVADYGGEGVGGWVLLKAA